jgi:hypothetical protein
MFRGFLFFAFALSLNAQDIKVSTEWQLMGVRRDIAVSNFDDTCTRLVWRYQGGEWQVYIPVGGNYSYETLIESDLKREEGFWVIGDSNCTISTQHPTQFDSAELNGHTYFVVSEDKTTYFAIKYSEFYGTRWRTEINSFDLENDLTTQQYYVNSKGTLKIDNHAILVQLLSREETHTATRVYVLQDDGSYKDSLYRNFFTQEDAEAFLEN